ncbi:jg13507 [Pararge aegeria aegeria]|uniref:Jg13507 protein n=1 Tax=Pararge aegeria aegeria TaxID=348720 RepID=A0A8S4QDZ1_9NEOP|nr:jg13507 [Pararge aegeria aegeria]
MEPGSSLRQTTRLNLEYETYPHERSFQRERPAPELFTSIKLPEAEPPNGVAPLLDFPRGRMRPVTFLGEGPHGTVSTCYLVLRITMTELAGEVVPHAPTRF